MSAALVRRAGLGLALFAVGSCSDLTTEPARFDPVALSIALPCVVDARLRLSDGILDAPLRGKMIVALANLEIALRQGSANGTLHYLDTATGILAEYRALSIDRSEPDLSGIELALTAVSAVLGFSV